MNVYLFVCLFLPEAFVSPLLEFFLAEGGFVSKKKKPVVCHSLVLTDIQGRSCKLVPDIVQCTFGSSDQWRVLIGEGLLIRDGVLSLLGFVIKKKKLKQKSF